MQGHRIRPNAAGVFPWADLRPGDYFMYMGFWMAKTPNDLICGLRNHSVTEHDDGTITVSPSILVSNGEGREMWHGFLERGVWREC